MLTASGMFGYSINTIGIIFSELFKHSEDIRKDMYIINNFMNIKQINKELQFAVRDYLNYYYLE